MHPHPPGRPQGAFNVATAGWVPCGILLASISCCMRRDEAAMQARLAKSFEAKAVADPARAEDGGGVDRAGGITVVLPPPTTSSGPDGGAGPAAIASAATVRAWDEPAAVTATSRKSEVQLLREERRMAKVGLLVASDGVSYSRSDECSGGSGGSDGVAYLPLPQSSSAVVLDRAPAAPGRGWWGSPPSPQEVELGGTGVVFSGDGGSVAAAWAALPNLPKRPAALSGAASTVAIDPPPPPGSHLLASSHPRPPQQ